MKKALICAMISLALAAISCTENSSEDEILSNDLLAQLKESKKETSCKSCVADFITMQIETVYCDNGDGTVTIKIIETGEETTDSLNGLTFNEFMLSLEKNSTVNCKYK